MSAITTSELLQLWKQEELPIERSIGQILQHLDAQQINQESFQLMLLKLRSDVDRLIVHTKLPPNPKGKVKPFKPDDEIPNSEQPN